MKLTRRSVDGERGSDHLISMSTEETELIMNCINEALEILDEGDFHARTGFSRSEARTLRSQARSILDEVTAQD